MTKKVSKKYLYIYPVIYPVLKRRNNFIKNIYGLVKMDTNKKGALEKIITINS